MNPQHRPHRTVEQIRLLDVQSGLHVRKQHVVSQLILRRFTATNGSPHAGRIGSINLEWPSAKPCYYFPAGTGYIADFVRFASSTMEKVWHETENCLPEAIDACCDKTVLSRPDLIEVLKGAIAMHHVRNVHLRSFLDPIWHDRVAALRRLLLTERRAMTEHEFRRRYHGLVPGPGCLESIVDDALAPMEALWRDDGFFRDSLERLYRLSVSTLADWGLQVCMPATGEFVLGDAPALAISSDGRIGLRDGVGLNEAVTIALPITPLCMIALGETDTYITLSQDQVDVLNCHQIRGSARHMYFRPGSNLEPFIRANAHVSRPHRHTRRPERLTTLTTRPPRHPFRPGQPILRRRLRTVGGIHPHTALQLRQLSLKLGDPGRLHRNQQGKLVIGRTLRHGLGHPGTLSHQPIPVDHDTPTTQAEHVLSNADGMARCRRPCSQSAHD